MLLVALVISTVGYSQDEPLVPFKDTFNLPNFSLISTGLDYVYERLVYDKDSTPLYSEEELQEFVKLGWDPAPYASIKEIKTWFVDSLITTIYYQQNVFFDFKNSTVTFVADDKNITDTIINIYIDPKSSEPNRYWVSTVYSMFGIDFNKQTIIQFSGFYDPRDENQETWYPGEIRLIGTKFIEY